MIHSPPFAHPSGCVYDALFPQASFRCQLLKESVPRPKFTQSLLAGASGGPSALFPPSSALCQRVALRDLERIRDFIARDNPAAAVSFCQKLLDRAEALREFPERPLSHSLGECAWRAPAENQWMLGKRIFSL